MACITEHHVVVCMKGMAFTLKERQILGIHGLLPPNVCTPDEQKARVMNNVRRFDTDLDKYIYLVALLDRNEKLFYQVGMYTSIGYVHTVIANHTVTHACKWCKQSSQIYNLHEF